MQSMFSVPSDYKESFQRLVPYMPAFLRNDEQAQEAILLYLKLGGEKLARCAIDAYIQTQRLNSAEAQKRLLQEALLAEQLESSSEEGDEEGAEDSEGTDEEPSGDSDY